jgi:hypothetical protein
LSSSPNTPGWPEVIDNAISDRLSEVFTAFPAEVTSYDRETRTCSARPLIDLPYPGEDGTTQYAKMNAAHAVPVCWPGGGGFTSGGNLKKGEVVLLVYCTSSIQNWKLGQGTKPRHGHNHSLNDGIAIPGLFPMAGRNRPKYVEHSEMASIGLDGKTDGDDLLARVWFHPAGQLRLGSPSANAQLTRINDVKDAFKSILSNVGIVTALGALITAIATGIPGTIAAARSAMLAAIDNAFATNQVVITGAPIVRVSGVS